LLDPRLRGIITLLNPQPGDQILDVGCGRGEIVYMCALNNTKVTGLDYSPAAIDLAKRCFIDDIELSSHATLLCTDVNNFTTTEKYDKVVAADVIEHLAPLELDKLYEKISSLLTETGFFVVHTYPNLWIYQYGYAIKRRQAKRVGCYLSPNPRSEYEQLMHINEQSPRVLKRQLQKYFKQVTLWLGDSDNPIASLVKQFKKSDFQNTRDVFALASNTALDLSEVISRFIQVPLTSTERANLVLQWVKISAPQRTNPEEFFVKLLVVNNSHQTISSSPPYPVNIAYHWLSENGEVIEYDGVRTTLPGAIVPHSKTSVWIRVRLPVNRQRTVYRLVISLVQEAVAWFDQDNPAHPISVRVSF